MARFDGVHLPYINSLVNLIIIQDADCRIPAAEITRVLAPYGKVVAPQGCVSVPEPVSAPGDGQVVFTKPYPANMDEWPQYLHGADNNCVARDTVVGPPRHVQWISSPAWTRAHIGAATISSMVSSGGRLFTIEDTETAENPLLPAKWQLIARNAFNGIVLWSLDYPDWEQVTVYIKDYHAQMQRRLLALGNTVYCTPGLSAPITALDAMTGKTIRQFQGTAGTQELVFHEGRIFAVIGDRMSFYSYRGAGDSDKRQKQSKKKTQTPAGRRSTDLAFNGQGFKLSLYNPRTRNVEKPACVIAAFDAQTGRELWRSPSIADYVGCTLALKGGRLVYQSAHGVFCLNAKTGVQNWSVKKEIPYGLGNRPNSLVLSEEAVYSEEGKDIYAYALADGKDFWGKSIPARKGYQASTDLLIAADALWMCGTCNNPKGTVIKQPTGDIIVSNGTDYYSVFGMPVTRGDTFDARDGYVLTAKTKSANGWARKWAVRIPITGKAMVLACDTVFAAGAPLVFDDKDLGATYAGRCGGVLWAVSAPDGAGLARYRLDRLPAWDGMAAAYGRLFIVNQDGSVDCWGK